VKTIQLLAYYVPLLVTFIAAISASLWELLESFTEPVSWGVAITLLGCGPELIQM
jgi:hypothetical protein